jgi:DNA-binding PadR family transcriptional regulator
MFHHHHRSWAYAEEIGRRHARGFFGQGHGHWRGMRAGRFFDHGDLRFLILKLIADKPRHGYDLIKAIEEEFGGAYSPSPGVIYPTLTMLEELGHATVAESDGKKLYTITAEGTAYIDANKAALDQALRRMQTVNTAHGGGPAPEIMRARENLKLALRLREARGPLTEQQIRDIAAALDAAAVAIERS